MQGTVVYEGAEVAGQGAVAVQGGRIAGLGDAATLRRRFPDCTVRYASGHFLPAALDGHLHLVEYGLSLSSIDLLGLQAVQAWERLTAARAAAGTGGFLVAVGARPPVLAALALDRDRLQALGPLCVWAQDLHTALTDPQTLRTLGLDRQTPAGGAVERDAMGSPTGILYETATALLARAVAPDASTRTAAVRRAIKALYKEGVVGAVTFEDVQGESAVLTATADLPFQAFIYRYADDLERHDEPAVFSDRVARVGAKYFLDGTLGSRTAWLFDPYADGQGTGMARLKPEEARPQMQVLAARGFSLALHAIGDRAATEALALLQGLPAERAPHRIEHLQLVARGFAQELARAHVTASVQPCHLQQDIDEARSAWADRLAQAYPYRALHEAGALLAFGSDAPVESPALRLGLRWATGADAVGGGVRHGLDIEDAYLAYTTGVYHSVGREGGRIAVGERADLALYDEDPLQGAPKLVLSEGVEVYRAEGEALHRPR